MNWQKYNFIIVNEIISDIFINYFNELKKAKGPMIFLINTVFLQKNIEASIDRFFLWKRII